MCLIVAASLVPATAALAGPRAKAHYDGVDATHQRALIVVNKDGSKVAALAFGTRGACTDGKRRALLFLDVVRRPAKVLPDGSFSKTLRDRSGHASVRGRFDAVGNSVTGTYNIVDKARRYTCRTGDVPFTLNRDGTAGAPYRNASVATGLYRAAGRGLALRMRTVFPSRIIHSLRAEYATRCSSGKRHVFSVALPVGILTRGWRFVAVVRDRQRLKTGGAATTRARIVGAFGYDNGYTVAGALRVRNVIRRPGRRPAVCRATIPFTGRFVRGPLGEEGPNPGH